MTKTKFTPNQKIQIVIELIKTNISGRDVQQAQRTSADVPDGGSNSWKEAGLDCHIWRGGSCKGLSIVRQLVRPSLRPAQEYFALYRSQTTKRQRLDEGAINYTIRELGKGRSTLHVAEEMGTRQRRVQQLWAEFWRTGKPHVAQRPGRSAVQLSKEQVGAVMNTCKTEPAGITRTAKYVRGMDLD